MKILIVKTSSLGDLIHVFPVVEYLKAKKASVEIHWVVEKPFSELLAAHPLIDNVFTINSKAWRKKPFSKDVWSEIALFKEDLKAHEYDVVFDFQGNTKSAFVTALSKGKEKVGFGKAAVAEWPNLLATTHKITPSPRQNIRADYLCLVQEYYQDSAPFVESKIDLRIDVGLKKKIDLILQSSALQKPYKVLVCPGSIWPNKRVSLNALEGFLKKLEKYRDCCFLFAWGDAEEKAVADELQKQFSSSSEVLERLPLAALQNLMGQMDLVVAMDSLPLHLAGTTKVATFSVFGPTLASKYKPEGSQHLFLQGQCPYDKKFEKRCPILRSCKTGLCMKGLSAEALFDAYHGKL